MSSSSLIFDTQGPPLGYVAPSWPSLDFTFGPQPSDTTRPILWYTQDVVTFTLIWSLIFFSIIYGLAGLLAFFKFSKTRIRIGLFLLIGFLALGLIIGATIGAAIGAILASFYKAGLFSMSTWVPMAWAAIGALVAIIFSYSQVSLAML